MLMANQSHATELRLFPVLIPLINVFNYYLTYNNIQFDRHTFLTFMLDTLMGYVAWIAVHVIIVYLDKRLPFAENIAKRLTVQIVTTVIAGMSVIIILTVLAHIAFSSGPIPPSFFYFDVFIISVWFLVINGIYISLYLFRQWREAENKRIEENKIKAGGLMVRSGKQEFMLDFGEISGFIVDGEYIACITTGGKKFLMDQSMDKLEKQTPSAWFFRMNRQFMVHRQIISGYEKGDNGKLNVLLKSNAFPEAINVSRTRAATFKNWFQPG
jgi:hypothetical protein